QRWLRIVAAAKGLETAEDNKAALKNAEVKSTEQPSYAKILETRALKNRDLELREQELRNGVAQLNFQETKLADDTKLYEKLRDNFDAKLASLTEGSKASGQDEVRRTLETIKPKQAKELILQMLDNKELDVVVSLLSPMPDAKRAKIIGQFKTPEELEKISEVLRRIREGLPAAKLSENATKKLEQTTNQQL
ncbi:MAG: hypothetical protein ACWGMZ_07585, partial [Thermoguttaceae bacterium]